MATIRLMREEGEYADVPEGSRDEAALRKLGFKDLPKEKASKADSKTAEASDAEGDELPPWPLKTSPEEYLEQQAELDDHSDVVLARMELARRHIEAADED